MDLLNIDITGCDEEAENDDGIQRLVEGLNISDLSTSGAEFRVHVNEDAALEEQNTYDGPTVFPHLNLNCLGEPDEESAEEPKNHDADTPFESLALKMNDLTKDGKVKKRILTEGYGEVVPPEALVWFHYNSYFEDCDIPFDSSYLRGPMTMIRLNSGKCIVGLDIGLSTMKLGEKAELLIHYDYAYGKLGVFPRIPRESPILIQVEMKKFVDNALALKMGELNEEELKNMPFQEIYKGALSLLHEGNSAFFQKKLQLALKWYRNALRSLEHCDMKDDGDDLKNENLRMRLYTNMGVCHNKLNNSKQAIVACRNALQINPKGAKILYQLGLAHLNLSSFDEAKKFAFKARNLEPNNPDVSSLLQKIDSKIERYNTSAVTFAKNAFKFSEKNSQKMNNENQDSKENKTANGVCVDKTESCEEHSSEFSMGAKIIELPEAKETEVISRGEYAEKNLLPAEAYTGTENEREFQLEVISFIQEFFEDTSERELPVPSGLTYEEEMFFKKQAILHGLRWEERQNEGKITVYLLK